MKPKNPGAKSVTEGRIDLEITVCRNGVVNVRNPDYERGHTYSVILGEAGEAVRCSCKGHRFHGHCYHADEVEARPLVVSSASAVAESKTAKRVATEGYKEPVRSEAPDMGGGESTGVVDL